MRDLQRCSQLNTLVVGVDSRPPESKEAQEYGARSDAIMLVQIVPETERIRPLSVPRDLLLWSWSLGWRTRSTLPTPVAASSRR
jgi:anionic cell wall polymer biosynthesis LytR-Cps2A-Psr (LCP) family protein